MSKSNHKHRHEDEADMFKRRMLREKELMKILRDVLFKTLCAVVVILAIFLLWIYDVI